LPTDLEKWQKVPLFISGTATGTANAITLNVVENYQDFSTFDKVTVIASANNTGATTLLVGSGAVIGVNKAGQIGLEPLSGGEILNGIPYDFEFNGSIWILKNPSLATNLIYSQVTFLDASSQTISSGTTQKIQFNNTLTDITLLWDAINHRYIVNKDVNIDIICNLFGRASGAGGGNQELRLYKNGSFLRYIAGQDFSGVAGDNVILSGTSGTIKALNGDYFEMFWRNVGGSSTVIGGDSGVNGDKNLFEIRYLGQ
jgi:hypothetical protein